MAGNANSGNTLKYKTPAELESAINEYFDNCDNRIQQVYSKKSDGVIEIINPEPYTMAGLAYALGMDRTSLLNYSGRPLFSSLVKTARNRVQLDVERRLMEGQPAGAIFNLKNNFGYKDISQQDGTTKFIVETRQAKQIPTTVKALEYEPDDDN